MKAPAPPRCVQGLSASAAATDARVSAAMDLRDRLRAGAMTGGDRLVVLLNALVAEVMDSAADEEAEAVEYLTCMLGHLVGHEIGRRAGLASMRMAGRA